MRVTGRTRLSCRIFFGIESTKNNASYTGNRISALDIY